MTDDKIQLNVSEWISKHSRATQTRWLIPKGMFAVAS